jgi:sigma-54 dependent transcriptional regulator, acetoin dehydrogenase operon transcriptional activator AcoR
MDSIAFSSSAGVSHPAQRLASIARARTAILREGLAPHAAKNGHFPSGSNGVDAWIAQSWQRCLSRGQSPDQHVLFEAISTQDMRRHAERSQPLREAARNVIHAMGQTLARTGYFALLTNAQGVVIDTGGPINAQDRRAMDIARVGVDLSEASVGTTAIGAALAEFKPVWLHRGEHFFTDTSVYSCAGAPIFGADGACVGMLDLTGVEAPERPELQHLVAQAAMQIENRLVQSQPHALSLQLYWPGMAVQQEAGWLGLDADGRLCAANRTARSMLGLPALGLASALPHCDEVFATAYSSLFDAAGRAQVDLPLWSGLTVTASAVRNGEPFANHAAQSSAPLKALTTDFIRKAVVNARGNVSVAAQSLGISRATVYRKLSGAKNTKK